MLYENKFQIWDSTKRILVQEIDLNTEIKKLCDKQGQINKIRIENIWDNIVLISLYLNNTNFDLAWDLKTNTGIMIKNFGDIHQIKGKAVIASIYSDYQSKKLVRYNFKQQQEIHTIQEALLLIALNKLNKEMLRNITIAKEYEPYLENLPEVFKDNFYYCLQCLPENLQKKLKAKREPTLEELILSENSSLLKRYWPYIALGGSITTIGIGYLLYKKYFTEADWLE